MVKQVQGVFKDFLIDPAKKTFLGEKKITNFDDLRILCLSLLFMDI